MADKERKKVEPREGGVTIIGDKPKQKKESKPNPNPNQEESDAR